MSCVGVGGGMSLCQYWKWKLWKMLTEFILLILEWVGCVAVTTAECGKPVNTVMMYRREGHLAYESITVVGRSGQQVLVPMVG